LPANKSHKIPKRLFLYLEIEILGKKYIERKRHPLEKKSKHKYEKQKQQGYPISQPTRNTCPK